MKYPLPLEIPVGHRPIITQVYGDKSRLAWYKSKGIDISEHNGTDIIIDGDPMLNYGTKIVCPVPKARKDKVWWDSPMSTKGNGIQIIWGEGGKQYQMLAWHCSEVVDQSIYRYQDAIAYIGNSGAVNPEPSPTCPYCGSHIHLMLYIDGVLTDPMTTFDINNWFVVGSDTPESKDLPPLFWVIDWLKAKINKLLRK